MSRDDYETGKTLLNPFIEIGKGGEPHPRERAYVNVETFRGCLGNLMPPRDGRDGVGLRSPNFSFYSVYGVVSRPIRTATGDPSVRVDEPPISRTLMGFVEESVLKHHLPKTFETLKVIKESKVEKVESTQ